MVVTTIKDGFRRNNGSALEYEEVFQQKMAGRFIVAPDPGPTSEWP